ncbi:DNA cytosine methyltransferase [Streptococcus suis]|uniref:Cytosine-specific methyltransferase n=1 Tax=Streptococcus suis TaxID=1307 RepID=A0A0Z8HUQ2_STRSU|nr:DNA cytosine methyltransferase [Streptococcus suis]NQM06627.1 DNA cytosine methyltransferase [Streptococcus suis]NQM27610.1 DNA cytosine methyltransferase [Streptococcus suis]NQM50952.1 DNA cytosine methyltransferase [Streptococcus suis]NQP53228.1 DNA cytosine methyltransferase [Streptococcus suis]CYV23625.1 type II DNA modification enzyme (methyltransferase cytosine-specific) [Streptococcus suis]
MINVVDLFSGAGGLTFGFQKRIVDNSFVRRDDFKINFANEFDKNAAEAFRQNYPDIPMIEGDIADLNIDYLTNIGVNIKDIDLVIGGPPCQSFSTVGKRQFDNRAKMYKEYRRLLSFLQPKMFVFENVLGLLTMKNDDKKPVLEDVKESFQDFSDFNDANGYNLHIQVLNAKDFGVPQNRERVFIIGVRNDLQLNVEWRFPNGIANEHPITLRDAISDLPLLGNNETINIYRGEPLTVYQRLMRGGTIELKNHSSRRHGDRMIKIMEALKEGQGKDDINSMVEEGKLPKELFLTSGYSNTYGRLWWDRPSTTITNNLSTPSSLRCIHPSQNRALTAREGARIQSFPDDYVFIGGFEAVNTQIGNAVPPILSIYLANRIADFFRENNL